MAMFGKRGKAPVPMVAKEARPWRALMAAVGVALLITVGAMVSFNQSVKQAQTKAPIWLASTLITGGSRISAADVKKVEVPKSAASLLSNGRSPVGKMAAVTIVPGSAISANEVSGNVVVIPPGDVGVWVATTPTQDGVLSIGQSVLPYEVPQSGSSSAQAQSLTTAPVEIVAISSQGGIPLGSAGSSVGLSTGLNAPAAVELAVPAKSAPTIMAAGATHTIVLAVPGGAH